MRRTSAILGVFALAAPFLLAGSVAADPLPPHVVGGRSLGSGFVYYNPVVATPVGGSLTLISVDIDRHNIQSVASGPDDNPWCASYVSVGEPCPLFWSPLVNVLPNGGGPTSEVQGLDQLEALESYEFFCTLHPEMRGTLFTLPEVLS